MSTKRNRRFSDDDDFNIDDEKLSMKDDEDSDDDDTKSKKKNKDDDDTKLSMKDDDTESDESESNKKDDDDDDSMDDKKKKKTSNSEDIGMPDIPQYMKTRFDDDDLDGDQDDEDIEDIPLGDSSLGNDTEGQENEYDQKDIEMLSKSISDELASVSSYMNNIMETSSDVLKKLYADIANEERFHAEQFLYAKSIITGETYEPQDPDIKSAYKELIADGVDGDESLSMVSDMMRLDTKKSGFEDDDDLDDDDKDEAEKIKEQFELLETAVNQHSVLYDMLCETYSKDEVNAEMNILMEAYFGTESDDTTLYMEAANIAKTQDVGKRNPFKMLFVLFKGIWKLAVNLITSIKRFIAKTSQKNHNRITWLKRNGFGALFKSGVNFYFWDIDTNSPDKNGIGTFTHLLFGLTRDVGKALFPESDNDTTSFVNNINDKINKYVPKDTKRIYTDGNVSTGIETVKDINLTKTKVVVTDENKANMIDYLFDGVGEKNMLNVLYNCLKGITGLSEDLVKFIQKANQVFNAPGNDINYDKFNEHVKNFKIIGKCCNLIMKACNHDINVLLKLYDTLDEFQKSGTVQGANASVIVNSHRKQVEVDQVAKEKAANAAPTKTDNSGATNKGWVVPNVN